MEASLVVDNPDSVASGGMKTGGHARFRGPLGVNEFTDVQWVSIADLNRHFPF
jgi:hypothetical protein